MGRDPTRPGWSGQPSGDSGSAAVGTADNIAAVMDRYGSVMSWRVQNAVFDGDQVNAELAVSIPLFGTRTHPIYWVNRRRRA
ncbi:hypothetical protein [Mycobacterium sp. IS-1742]|uniref:hypothetical protein n=1 Tax=Mycobacterium sp. IS-1742 TaxID=1772285 RepID=UPI000AC535BC|nr:hypothetical protein [Mycobacterium sp. IS-1742]